MKLINNKDDVYVLIQKIKQNGSSFITNFFIDQEKLNAWIQEGQLYFIEAPEGVLFFRKNYDFYHLYYCAGSLNDLSLLLSKYVSNAAFAVDIIGKKQDIEPVQNVFLNLGFKVHTTLERYTRINKEGSDNYQLSNEVTNATDSYSGQIAEMLQKNFDKYAEQVHTLQDVEKLIREGKIIMIGDNGFIKGFLIRTILPQSSILNNFLVNPEFRGEKIGSKLLKHYIFESRNTKRLWLWVLSDNEHAINLYKRHSYVNDGLIDLVLIFK